MHYIPHFLSMPWKTDTARQLAVWFDTIWNTIYWNCHRVAQAAPTLTFGQQRLHRTLRRLDSLILKWKTGRLPKPRIRPKRERKPSQAYNPWANVKTGKHWLIRAFHMTSCSNQHIAGWVETDEVKQLVAEAPQAGRILRPLLNMLAIDVPEYLKLAKKPKPPKPEVELVPHKAGKYPRWSYKTYSPGKIPDRTEPHIIWLPKPKST